MYNYEEWASDNTVFTRRLRLGHFDAFGRSSRISDNFLRKFVNTRTLGETSGLNKPYLSGFFKIMCLISKYELKDVLRNS